MTDSVVFTSTPTGPDAPVAPVMDAGGERPGWLPENFKSPEDFAKSASDTRAELTRVQQELAELRKQATPPKAEEKPPVTPDGEQKKEDVGTPEGEKLKIDEAPKPAAPAINFDPYYEEFAKTGDVAEERRAEIADKLKDVFGDNARAIVDDYIAGSKTRVQTTVDAGMQIAGGADNYKAMTAWAGANLSPEAKAHYNQSVNSGNYAAMELAIAGLRAKWEGAVGKQPSLVTGATGSASSDTFASLAEAKQAMADPRYQKDAVYRQEVSDKLRRTQMAR